MAAAFGHGAAIAALVGPDVPEAHLAARRKVARSLRAIEIALERGMKALSRNRGYDARRLWAHFSGIKRAEDGHWRGFTLDEAIAYVRASGEVPREARDGRIEALAVFRLLMERPDLFLGDEAGMRVSSRFSVRPVEDVECLERVQGWLEGYEGTAGSAEVGEFRLQVAQRVQERRERRPLTPFSETTTAFVHVIRRRIVERRSTQLSPAEPLVPMILRATGLYDEATDLDLAAAERLLKDIGEASVWDSFSKMRVEAAEVRDAPPPPRIGIANPGAVDDAGLLVHDPHANIRREFTAPVYVIDAADAHELDDGISIEPAGQGTWWVRIHIADPTRWIELGSDVARVAEGRGETLYYPEGGRGMISTGVERMSLGAGSHEGQPTLTFSIKVSDDGSLLDHEVAAGMVRNVHKITYDAVNRIVDSSTAKATERVWTLDLGNDVVDETFTTPSEDSTAMNGGSVQDLQQLHRLAVQLRRRRLDRQGFDFDIPSASVGIVGLSPGTSPLYDDKALQYRVGSPTQGSNAASMVAEFMVLAGRTAGKFAVERRLALPFRGTTRPLVPSYALAPGTTAETALEAFFDRRQNNPGFIDDMYDFAATGIVLQTAPISITPISHYALGIHAADGGYSRVTSPLRRFSDMLAHWQIKQSLAGGRIALEPEEMLQRVTYADRLAQRIKRIGSNAEAYWQMTFLQWLHAHRSASPLDLTNLAAKVFEEPAGDVILGINETSAKVFIPELRVMAVLHQPLFTARAIGEELRVRVKDVHIAPTAKLAVEPL